MFRTESETNRRTRKRPTRWTMGDARRFITSRATIADSRPDDTRITNRDPLILTCKACGYRWKTSRDSLLKERWCPRCSGLEPWTYGRVRAYAAQRNGQVLSDVSDETRCSTPVPVRCESGHRWNISKKCLDGEAWCPTCGRANSGKQRRRRTYGKDLDGLIGARGVLLSKFADDEWIFGSRRIDVRCKECSHEWSPSLEQIKMGQWCPVCAGNGRWTIGRVRRLVADRGGELLTLLPDHSPVRVMDHVQVRCSCGNTWGISPSNLQNGHWCARCAGKSEWTIGRIRKIVESRAGQLLSDQPNEQRVRRHGFSFWVRCAFGHEWSTNVGRLHKHWCPECASGQGEEICRAFMESLFGQPFPKARPSFLRYAPSGRNLELDGFCRDLAIAFEHHGLQHYEEVSLFKDSRISLRERKSRDKFKRKRCREQGVLLVEIPELHLLTKLDDLREVILTQCRAAGRRVPFPQAQVDAQRLVAVSKLSIAFAKAKSYATSRNGKCLSDHYIAAQSPMRWQCALGHQWTQSFHSVVKERRWCPECGLEGRKKEARDRLLERCRRYAKKKGGVVLSKECLGNRSLLLWKCREGHRFRRDLFTVLPKPSFKGRWCSKCYAAKKKHRLNKALLARCCDHARLMHGSVVSRTCEGALTPIRWKCKCGHAWNAKPAAVLPRGEGHHGTWCPKCRRVQASANRLKTLQKQGMRPFGRRA